MEKSLEVDMSERPDPDYVEPIPDDAESPAYRDDEEDEESPEGGEKNPFNDDKDFPNPAKDI
ncbi:hypothetical protein AL522_22900 [Pantoea vagans]|nr:hypothetical protein AL522_22900 [Pantoea vagans]